MARFFIDRPIFAWVLAIIIMLAGLLSINTLPVSQYPTIAPPTVSIRARYPGANAETVENTVTKIVEQALLKSKLHLNQELILILLKFKFRINSTNVHLSYLLSYSKMV